MPISEPPSVERERGEESAALQHSGLGRSWQPIPERTLQMAASASSNHVLELGVLTEPIYTLMISCIPCRPISLRPAFSVPIEIREVDDNSVHAEQRPPEGRLKTVHCRSIQQCKCNQVHPVEETAIPCDEPVSLSYSPILHGVQGPNWHGFAASREDFSACGCVMSWAIPMSYEQSHSVAMRPQNDLRKKSSMWGLEPAYVGYSLVCFGQEDCFRRLI